MPDRTAKSLSGKIFVFLALRRFFSLSTVCLFAWGGVSVLFRAVAGVSETFVFTGIGGLSVLIPIAVLLELKNRPRLSNVYAYLDLYNHSGGLLMASRETDASEWLADSRTKCPSVSWRGSGELATFALALLFATASAFTPHWFAGQKMQTRLQIDETVDDLREKIEIVEREEVIESLEAEELESELDKLEKNAVGEDPARTWEALDHMDEGIRSDAEEFAVNEASKIDEINRSLAFAEILSKSEEPGLNREAEDEIMRNLMEMLKKQGGAEAKNDLTDYLDKDILESIGRGKPLSKDQLKRLRSKLDMRRKKIAEKLRCLSQCELIEAALCKKDGRSYQKGADELAAFLEKNLKELVAADIAVICQIPGKGGLGRGRADAAMTWKDETDETGARFREQALPPSAIIGESSLMGVSAAAPEKTETTTASAGVLSGTSEGGGSASVHRVLPRHRGAVKRYFERGD